MRNIPRIFIDEKLEVGKTIPLPKDQLHYLTKVMRTDECLVFNDGKEYFAEIVHCSLFIVHLTEHKDPSNNLIFAFSPIKQSRMEEMLNMATQMGVAKLQPVITDHATEKFPKWERIRKIIIEASEQSNRNSIPELLPPIKFDEFVGANYICPIIFADERFAHNDKKSEIRNPKSEIVFVGPEGGFSEREFAALDKSGACGIGLGKTILRSETAAVALLTLTTHTND
jgi:16S rRNA (uracil1498-N3)-methyltransferase